MLKGAAIVACMSLAIGSSAHVLACGDKFLVPSRGVRFQPAVDRQSAEILVYARSGTALSATLANVPVERTLRTAGYRPVIVTTVDELQRAVQRGGWDVVVFDLADEAIVATLAPETSPIVLPIAGDVSRATFDTARKQYRHMIKSSTKPRAFLDAIDSAVAARSRSARRTGA